MECTTPRTNLNINYILWVTIMYPYRSIHCNKHITLFGNVDHMGGCAVGSEGTWENSLYFLLILL